MLRYKKRTELSKYQKCAYRNGYQCTATLKPGCSHLRVAMMLSFLGKKIKDGLHVG